MLITVSLSSDMSSKVDFGDSYQLARFVRIAYKPCQLVRAPKLYSRGHIGPQKGWNWLYAISLKVIFWDSSCVFAINYLSLYLENQLIDVKK